MPQVTLSIPQAKYAFFMKVLESYPFVRKVEEKKPKEAKPAANSADEEEDDYVPRTREQLLADLKESFEEVREVEAGRKQPTLLKDFLNEL